MELSCQLAERFLPRQVKMSSINNAELNSVRFQNWSSDRLESEILIKKQLIAQPH